MPPGAPLALCWSQLLYEADEKVKLAEQEITRARDEVIKTREAVVKAEEDTRMVLDQVAPVMNKVLQETLLHDRALQELSRVQEAMTTALYRAGVRDGRSLLGM